MTAQVVSLQKYKTRKRREEIEQLSAESAKLIDEAITFQMSLWRKMAWGLPPAAVLALWFDVDDEEDMT